MPIKTLEIPLFPHIPQLVSHPPASPTHESMKPVLTNAPADLLTCYPREAGANLLNLFQKFRLPFHLDCPAANAAATLFLIQERGLGTSLAIRKSSVFCQSLQSNSRKRAQSIHSVQNATNPSGRRRFRRNLDPGPCGVFRGRFDRASPVSAPRP